MPKVYLSNFVKGANPAVNHMLMDDNSFKVQNGVVTSHKIGAVLKDVGYDRVGDVAESAKSITGLFDSRETPSVQRMLLTVNDSGDNDTQLFYNNAGTWTEITQAETDWIGKANINVEMENFIGYTFLVGHGSTDGFVTPASLTNTTFSTSTNVTSMPNAKYIRRYRDRLYIANCDISGTAYPYRVYFSSVPSAGAITWTAATDFIDVDYSEEITGIAENWDYLLIFTEYMVYYYNQTSFKKLWEIGCSNHRTIKNYSAYMIWANGDGVWVSANMGRPQNISGNIIDFIRASTPSAYFAEVVDEEYHLYVGDVTVDGVDYTNVMLTFSFPTSSWRWRELSDTMTIFAQYNDSGSKRLYMGDDAGIVWDKSKYTDATPVYTDSTISGSGDPIAVNCETKPYYFDDPSVRKRLRRVTVFADRAVGVSTKMRVYDRNTRALRPYESIGQLTKYINVFEPKDVEFNMLQFEFSEYSSNEYFSILGMVVEYDVVSVPSTNKQK